ncbi:helix-turn-helix domain-containing protein [Ferruginibacter sp. SUN106]|uniref:helix-turn-helix domain-containing protein n=1 Tax=Ferruginibacter sp. SUN106 TaxID=2978348 RepID=UPI003D35C52B
MVSIRCKMVVKAELDKLGLHYGAIDLGEVEIDGDISPAQYDELKKVLLLSGLELMYDKNAMLVEKLKAVIIEMIHYADELPDMKKSEYISKKLNYNYTKLSTIFSEATGITIEQYIINHKVEKVKELLLYDELSLIEISNMLQYSSVSHLSSQFKKITGLSPTYFRQLKKRKNK